jgi:RNA polymerase sigma-70 factor (ECF subfamily)
MQDEKELVRRILAGDPEAQKAFYERNAGRLYPVCVHFLGYQDPDAEDIIQETFLIALKKLSRFEFRSSLYTWLDHICVNLCFERLRKRKRELASLAGDLEKLTRPQAQSLDNQQRAEDEKKGRLEILRRLTQSMSNRCREVLDLRDQRGESYIHIAKTLKMPMGTVMSQLARCRKALRQMMENEIKGAGL